MSPSTTGPSAEALERRAMRFRLASLAAAYPPADLAARIRELQSASELPDDAMPRAWMQLTDADVSALQSAYIDLFDRRQGGIPLHETEYGRGRALAKGAELADLSGFYRAFGVDLDADGDSKEMPDHLSVELEFYAWLLLKEAYLLRAQEADAVSIVEDARAKFLKAHLGPFARALSERDELEAGSPHRELLGLCTKLVASECALLGLEIEALTHQPNPPEPDLVECGAASFDAPGPRPGRLPVLPPGGE